MVDSNGYIMFDLSCLDFSKHNQIIDGIYQRTFEVIGAYKFVILLGVQGKTPIPACVSFTNGSYVIESFVYNFAITSDDNVRIENVSSDIIKDGVISAGSTWSSQKINNELSSISVNPFIKFINLDIPFSVGGYGQRLIKGSEVSVVIPDGYTLMGVLSFSFSNTSGNYFIQSLNIIATGDDNFLVIKNPFTGSINSTLSLVLVAVDSNYVNE